MSADLILTAGPFFGHIDNTELRNLSAAMHKCGCHFQRAHQHKAWIIMEGWLRRPAEQGDLPSPAYLDALCNKEITHGAMITQGTPRA